MQHQAEMRMPQAQQLTHGGPIAWASANTRWANSLGISQTIHGNDPDTLPSFAEECSFGK